MSVKTYVAPQKLDRVHQVLGSDLCRALEWLTSTLHFDFAASGKSAKAEYSPRDYAELREAKSLVSYLKYPDPTEPVRADEMGWALKLIKESYCNKAHEAWGAVFDKAALLLGIDLALKHTIPQDLDRKISNEIQMLTRGDVPLPLAAAV